MGLYVEEIRAKDGVGLDLVEHDLTAEMFVAEVKTLLADCLCLDPVVLQLVSIVLNNLLDLLMDAFEMVPASLKPLLFTIILELKHCIRNDFMDQINVILRDVLGLAFSIYVKMHGQEENVLVET